MRDEFIAIGPMSVCALMLAGFMIGDAMRDWNVDSAAGGAVALMLLLAVRSEARQPFAGGTYERGWFKWTRKGTE